MFPENKWTPHGYMIPPTIYIYDAVTPMPVVLDLVLNVMTAWVNTHHMGLCVGLQWMMWRQEQPNTGQEYLNIVQQWCARKHAEHDHIAWHWVLKFIFTYAWQIGPFWQDTHDMFRRWNFSSHRLFWLLWNLIQPCHLSWDWMALASNTIYSLPMIFNSIFSPQWIASTWTSIWVKLVTMQSQQRLVIWDVMVPIMTSL